MKIIFAKCAIFFFSSKSDDFCLHLRSFACAFCLQLADINIYIYIQFYNVISHVPLITNLDLGFKFN